MAAEHGSTIVILRAGDAIAPVAVRRGQFASWIEQALRPAWSGDVREFDVRTGAPPVAMLQAAAIVVTGSSSSVTERAPWMLRTEAFLAQAVEANLPILGICFGHQLLAQALGGEVMKNPRGWEVGTVTVRQLRSDPLFTGLPPAFAANATHVDTVGTVPRGATVLATTDRDNVAAFAIRRARGVQFHPEIDGDIMRGYLDARRGTLHREGFDVPALHQDATDTPSGATILQNFVRYTVDSVADPRALSSNPSSVGRASSAEPRLVGALGWWNDFPNKGRLHGCNGGPANVTVPVRCVRNDQAF